MASREDRWGTSRLQQEASLNLFVYRALIAGLQAQTKNITTSIEDSYIQYENAIGEEPYWSIVLTDFSADDVVKVIIRNFGSQLAQASRDKNVQAISTDYGMGIKVTFGEMSLAVEALNTNYYRAMFKLKRALADTKSNRRKYKQLYMFPFFSPQGVSEIRPEQYTTLKDRRDAIKESFWRTFNPLLERMQQSGANFLVPVFSRALIGALFFNTETGWSHVSIREKFPPRGISADEGFTPTKAQIRYANYRWSGLKMNFTEDKQYAYWNIGISWDRLPPYAQKIENMYHFWQRFGDIIATRDFRREMYDNLQDILSVRKPAMQTKAEEPIKTISEPEQIEIAIEKDPEISDIKNMLLHHSYKELNKLLDKNRDGLIKIFLYIVQTEKNEKLNALIGEYGYEVGLFDEETYKQLTEPTWDEGDKE